MNSPVEDRLREALVEAGATIDPSTLRSLRAPERRRFRVDFRLVAVAMVVVVAGAATAVGLGGRGGVDQVVATDPEPAQGGTRDMVVFLCMKSAPKEVCQGRAVRPEEVKAIERKLTELPQTEAVFFDNRATAHEAFRAEFAGNKALLNTVKITDLPMSFRLRLKEGADQQKVRDALHEMPGIQRIVEWKPQETMSMRRTLISVFLCGKGSSLPTCGAERKSRGKDGDTLVKRGKAATAEEKEAIQKLIEAMPEVRSFVFEDQKTAYENFQRAYKSNKALAQATKVTDMPESFRVMLKRESEWAKVVGELTGQPGVGQVVYTGCVVDQAILSDRYGLTLPDSKVCPAGK